MNWILDRLSENSTWRGLITLATATGVFTISPNLAEAIIAAGLGIVGLVNIIRSERK